jgi:DNA-binding NtrC family response regulator
MATILVVEDEAPVQTVFCRTLNLDGHRTVGVSSGEEALRVAGLHPFDMALLDLKLPGMDGLQTLDALRACQPLMKAVMVTGFGTIPTAVSAMRAGAYAFLEKPVDLGHLKTVVESCLDTEAPPSAAPAANEPDESEVEFEGMIGACAQIREVFRLIRRAAPTPYPVLITGETGTGKELVARALHRYSPRHSNPFVDVSCAAGQVTLFESEFFGHERGAFTDAREMKVGRFEQANKGTLFLDEIGELPPEAQAKLLRVIERGEATRTGGTKPVRFDVRLVAATNTDLEAAVARGAFRRDLYHRLSVLTIRLPALRERADDVALLVDHVFDRLRRQRGMPAATLSAGARRILLSHDWPGNVRELQHVLLRAIMTAKTAVIEPGDLPALLPETAALPKGSDLNLPTGVSLTDHVDRVRLRIERALILQALDRADGSRVEAAKLLGITERTLFRKLRELN